LNEIELIKQLQQGNRQAYTQLVQAYQHMVYNTVLGIIQQVEEAEDVAQEVFIQVYQSVGKFRADSKLSTWIYRIAVTKSLDWQRKKKAKKRFNLIKQTLGFTSTPEAEEPVNFNHPGVQLDNKEQAAILFKALNQLPENQKVAFVLIKTEGLNYEETSIVLNTTVKAVEALMHRAKANLKKILQDYYTDNKQ
jgi:RNA polymerase sigma factor (sigma-70 family)